MTAQATKAVDQKLDEMGVYSKAQETFTKENMQKGAAKTADAAVYVGTKTVQGARAADQKLADMGVY